MEEIENNQALNPQNNEQDLPLDGNLLDQIARNMSFIGIASIIGSVLIVLFLVYFLSVGSKYNFERISSTTIYTTVFAFILIIAVLLFISGLFLRKGKYAFEQFFRTSSLLDFHNGINIQITFFSIYIALIGLNLLYQIIQLFI
jgi:hypothetical protein